MKPFLPLQILKLPTRVLLFSLILTIGSFSQLFGQTNTWDGSSSVNWNTAANWSLNQVPTNAHDVVIPNGGTRPSITVNTAAVCKSFTISGGANANTVTISGTNSLTVTNGVAIGAGTGSGDNKILAVGTGSLVCSSISVTAAGNSNRTSGVTLSTGNITVSGNITMGDINDDFTFTGAGTLNIGGNMSGGTFTPSTGRVNYNGTNQTVGNYSYYNLTLSNSGIKTYTVTAARATNVLTVNNGVTLLLDGNNTLTPASATINGNVTVQNTSTLTKGTGVISFNSGSTYEHARDAGTIPTATWDAGSNCMITGITSTVPTVTSFAQSFGSFTWNSAGQTVDISLAQNLTSIAGDLTINSTGNGSLRLVNGGGSGTISVTGDYGQTGGALYICGTSSASNTELSIGGNFSLSTGTLNINGQTGTGSLNVAGDFTMNSGTITESNVGTSNVTFNGTNQTYLKTGGTISNTINFTVNNGSTLEVGTSIIDGSSGTFTLSSGAGIITAHAQGLSKTGLTGSIQVAGTRTYNNGANYTYNGSVAQSTGDGLTGAVNLTINNAAGVTLSAATTVSGTLALVHGTVTSSATNTLTLTNSSTSAITGGTASSFVNGPLIWQLTTGQAYIYPIGEGSTYLPFELTDITGSAPRIRAEAFAGNCGGSVSGTLGLLSTTEYWQASVISGTYTTGTVSLTRQTALNGLEVIARSATQGGAYASLNGSINGTSIISSDLTGNALGYFVMAEKASITTGTIASTAYCPGVSVDVPYTIKGIFTSENIFTAQLSNSSGSFASPVTIGTLNSANGGVIAATIPAGTSTGTGYRIRVVSSNPAITGSANGTNLTINQIPTAPVVGIITQPSCAIPTGSVTLSGLPNIWTLTRTPGGVVTTGTGSSTTISGLAADNTYTFNVSEGDNSGTSGTGLTGSYYNNMTLSGTAFLTKVDPTISFDWVAGSPAAGMNVDNYSVSWTGLIQPVLSGNYLFTTNSDDGVRLWIDGIPIIDNWTNHAATINTGSISLNAGQKYSIVLEYYESAGNAILQLSWTPPGQSSQIIPQSQLFPVVTTRCNSYESANVPIYAVPTPPATPVASVTVQPTCATSTGTVVVSSPIGAAYEYQLNAGTYQASPTFTGVLPGNHSVNARLAASVTCISPASSTLTVDAVPTPPATPVASVTVQPTCATPTGTVVVSSPIGTDYEYQLDAGTYQASPTFTGVSPGTHSVNARLAASPTCISSTTGVVVNAQPVTPSAPTVGAINQPTCSLGTGSVELNGLPGSGTWTLTRSPGEATTAGTGTSTTISGLTAGTYTYTVTNAAGCNSEASVHVTINAQPETPVITEISPGSRCGTGTVTIGAMASWGIVNWYDALTGGTFLGTGESFITPNLSSSTTYYAEAMGDGCISGSRAEVTASVITPPSISASGGGTFCSGSMITLNSTSSNITNQYWVGPNNFYSLNQNAVLTGVTSDMSGQYIVTGSMLSGINLVSNGDFEAGNTGFTSDYTTALPTSAGLYPEGTYDIVTSPSLRHANFCSCSDHTPSSGTLQMVINGASAEKGIWSQTVNINPNTAYQFTYWVQTVVNGNDASPSKLQLYVNGTNAGPVYTANPTTGVWTQFTYNWTSCPDDTRAVLTLKNENFDTGGNDFALDDIVFQQACEVTDNVTIIVNATVTSGTIGTNQSICKGDTPATLTSIAAGTGSGMISYEWQSNASGSYVTISGATTATYSPPALVATTSYQRRTVSVSGGITCYSPYTTPVTITVNAPTAVAGGSINACQSATPVPIALSGANVGGDATTGAWSIVSGGGTLSSTLQTSTPSAVTYTPAAHYSGTVLLKLTSNFTGSCTATSDRIITIVPAPTAVAGPALFACSNSGSVNITEGSSATNSLTVVWTTSGTGIFANANSLTTATYTPSVADIAAGSVTLTLTATGTSPCGNAISTKTLTITPLPVATFSFTDSPYCSNSENPSPTFSGGGVAGIFSSSPEGLVFVSNATGEVDLTASTPGIYNVTNAIAASGGCDIVTATATIAIVRLPVATFSYPQSPYCSNSANPVPLFIGGGVAGTFSSSAGLKFMDNNTGEIDLKNSMPGTYTVTNTIISSACGMVTAFSDVTVNDAPTASGVTICTGGSGSLQFNSICPDLNGLTRGPNNPGTGASISGFGSVAWINPGNITTNNSLYATAAFPNTADISNYIYARDYGFNIPANAIITGIQVIVNRSSSHSFSIKDNVVQLIVNGNIAGLNKAVTTRSWPTAMTSVTYGSSSDMWSLTSATLTPAVVNASNFGVAVACEKTASGGREARINYIQVTITYKIMGEIKWYNVSSGGTAIYTGSSFNPVGVSGGLVNTNTPGTYTFYAECSTNTECRAQADFVINARPIIANKTVTTCSGTAFAVSPTNGIDIVPTGTTYSWPAPSVAGITGTAAASNAASISGTLTNTTNTPINVTYTVTPSSESCSGNSFTVTIKVNPDGSWTGAMDTDWNNPANWACNQLPNLATNVTIAGGLLRYPIVSTDPAGMANDITIATGASVTVIGNTLQIAGAISNTGAFDATKGTIEMIGASAQSIGANVFSGNTVMNLKINNLSGVTLLGPLNITGVVSPLIGNLNSGGHLTLLSIPTQTALIDGVGTGTVTGMVNMQRYLSSTFGYKYFSSPFKLANVGAFATLVNLKEKFPVFYRYDENNRVANADKSGWVADTIPASPLIPMIGYAANLGTTTTPQTFTMSGVVNNGSQSLTLYNNNREYTKGFNLVGNPYPSPIDWDASGWTKTNIDDAIYFFNAGNTDRYTGTYSSYVDGKATGNANNIIAAMQGFFVHVTDGSYPVTATLGVTNAVRENILNPVFKRAMIDSRPTIHLTAGFDISNAIEDVAIVYFDPTARALFEKEKDALKLENTDEMVPNIYTIAPDSRKLSINGLSEPSDSVSFIPLGITTFRDGLINFRAEDVDDLPFMQVYLADAVTGKYHDLKQSPDVRFSLQRGVYDSRFKLVFSKAPFTGHSPGLGKLFTLVRSGNRILVRVDLPDNSKGNLLVSNLLGQAIMRREVSGKQTVEINQSITTRVYVITLVSGKRTESEKILMRTDYE